jgi:hypothetical protein
MISALRACTRWFVAESRGSFTAGSGKRGTCRLSRKLMTTASIVLGLRDAIHFSSNGWIFCGGRASGTRSSFWRSNGASENASFGISSRELATIFAFSTCIV